MILQILGCGTSTGVPIPGCECAVCLSPDPKNSRTRTSALIRLDDGRNILIDASTDLRQQALRWGIKRVDAVLFTHAHADHILGTDDLRCFNFILKKAIPCYGTAETLTALTRAFEYIFKPDPEWEGGLLPQLELNEIRHNEPFRLFEIEFLPFLLSHGKSNVTGFRFNNAAYATDCNGIPLQSTDKLKNLEVFVLDALRYEKHSTHFTIKEACEVSKSLAAKRTYLVHMTHSVDYSEGSKSLPFGIEFAYDGLQIKI